MLREGRLRFLSVGCVVGGGLGDEEMLIGGVIVWCLEKVRRTGTATAGRAFAKCLQPGERC